MRHTAWMVASSLTLFHCSESRRAEPTRNDSTGGTTSVEATAEKRRVTLDDELDFDLLDNRYLLHLGRSGLVIPMATEGLRKYTQEYAQPWKAPVELDGETGRVLAKRAAMLTFPWFEAGGARSLVVRMHGMAAGQRLTVKVNGRVVMNANVEPKWQTLFAAIPERLVRVGENQLSIHVRKATSVSGARSYGLFDLIEVTTELPDEANFVRPPVSWVRPVSIADQTHQALTGYSQMRFLVEIPEEGWLSVMTGGSRGVTQEVSAVLVGSGETRQLMSVAGTGAWQQHLVNLQAMAGKLVVLSFSAKGEDVESAAWARPRIAMASAPSRAMPKVAKNVILLVVDALRSDRMPLYSGVYIRGAVRMPNVVAQAEAGSVVFLHNQAASPSSPPSHGSIQTGMIPRVHGVDGDNGTLRPGVEMISKQLAAAGVATGYFGNNPFGMGRLEKPGNWQVFYQPGKKGKSNDCTVLMDMMIAFAGDQATAGKRFFISSLPYETHTPYRYHEGITENYFPGPFVKPVGKSVDGHLLSALSSSTVSLDENQWRQLRGLYDGEAEYMDGCFGRLVAGLRANGTFSDTAIVWTSDHGEGMFEHGKMGHAFGHYRELGDVPFVILWPDVLSHQRTHRTVTSHLDIAPTIISMMGVVPSRKIQGRNVLPLVERNGPWLPRVVSLEYGRSYGLRSERWKMIVDYNGQQRFFDLLNDPWEQQDISAERPLAVRYLRDLAGFFLAHRSRWHSDSWGDLNNHMPGFGGVMAEGGGSPTK